MYMYIYRGSGYTTESPFGYTSHVCEHRYTAHMKTASAFLRANTHTYTRRDYGETIACSSSMRFARYFPRDVYFYRRSAACTSVVNASIWKFALDADRKIKERLTKSPAVNINKRKPFVAARNFRMSPPDGRKR